MENPNLILIKSIIALYLNSKLETTNPKVDIVVNVVVETLRLPKNISGGDEEVTKGLLTTLEYLQYAPDLKSLSVVEINERIRLNCYYSNEYEETLTRLLSDTNSEEEIKNKVKNALDEINFTLRKTELEDLIRKANRDISFGDQINVSDFTKTLSEKLRMFDAGAVKGEHSGFAGRLSTMDPQSIMDTFAKSRELNTTEGMLQTGVKGINRMWGGGHRRGGQYNYGALTHNYKSGILLDYCKWIPMYNRPYLLDEKKKPLVLRISFENKPEQDLPIIYRSMYSAEYKVDVDITKIDIEEATKYVLNKLTKNGWNFEMLCYDPNNFDVWDLIDILTTYEDEGYEIAALIIDYPELMTKKQRKGAEMRKDAFIVYTFEVMRNHCFPRGITQITAHQHSTEAQKLRREDPTSYVSKVATGSYYMECQSLATKLDGDAAINIVPLGGRKFLMMGRGKDRYCSDTPEKHKYPILEFKRYGGIVADMDTDEDTTMYSFAGVDSGVELEVENTGPKVLVASSVDDW
jgi:hypothetical protein